MTQVIVVDDDQVNRMIVTHILQKSGYDVQAAKNGEEGLALIAARIPDLIILDVAMPVMDGVTVFKRLKAVEHLSAIPIIILTGSADETLNFTSAGLYPDVFLTKPAGSNTILRAVESVVATRATNSSLSDNR